MEESGSHQSTIGPHQDNDNPHQAVLVFGFSDGETEERESDKILLFF